MTSLRLGTLWFIAPLLLYAASAAAQAPPALTAPAETEIRSTVARWYEELAKHDEGNPYRLTAPGFIDASPHYRHRDTGSRALGPRLYTSLAATALKFSWEIDAIRADENFARVQVWERGYFYASAATITYERAAATIFVLERRAADGRWLILAHQSNSEGIPPHKVTKPMPDLSELHDRTDGDERDPVAPSPAWPHSPPYSPPR